MFACFGTLFINPYSPSQAATAGADPSKRKNHLVTPKQLLEKFAEMYTNSKAIKYVKNTNDSRNVEIDHH